MSVSTIPRYGLNGWSSVSGEAQQPAVLLVFAGDDSDPPVGGLLAIDPAKGTLLDAFPNSLIIQTHRDPLKTMPSHCSMITPLYGIYSDDYDAKEVGRFTCQRWAAMTNDVLLCIGFSCGDRMRRL